MSYATSTERGIARDMRRRERADRPDDPGFQLWHFYLLLSMLGATAAVIVSRNTHPVALLLISAAVIGAGFAGLALHRALAALFSTKPEAAEPLDERLREALLREKALVLRSIKELEFDHAVGKINAADFANINGRLRARALVLMQDLERTPATAPSRPAAPPPRAPAGHCAQCGTPHEADARFCKQCGVRLPV